MTTLRASMPYLERCNERQFRRELVVQALAGLTEDDRARVLDEARLELKHEASVA